MQKEQQKLVDAELLVDGVDVNVEDCALFRSWSSPYFKMTTQ